MLDWNFVKPYNPTDLAEYEEHTGFVFPNFYKRQLPDIHGGFPSDTLFTDNNMEIHEFKRLLPFQKDVRESIWEYEDLFVKSEGAYMPFALGRNNNVLCFENSDMNDKRVFLFNADDCEFIFVSDSFADFLFSLYHEDATDYRAREVVPYPYNLIQDIKDRFEEKYRHEMYEDGFDISPDSLNVMMREVLSEDDIDVLDLRYNKKKTLDCIGGKYHVTRERIRQRINHLIDKLSNVDCIRRFSSVSAEKYSDVIRDHRELEKLLYEIRNSLISASGVSVNMQDNAYSILNKLDSLKKNVELSKIESSDLSNRTKNSLRRAGYHDVYSLINNIKSPVELRHISNFGKACEYELLAYIHSLGLKMLWED